MLRVGLAFLHVRLLPVSGIDVDGDARGLLSEDLMALESDGSGGRLFDGPPAFGDAGLEPRPDDRDRDDIELDLLLSSKSHGEGPPLCCRPFERKNAPLVVVPGLAGVTGDEKPGLGVKLLSIDDRPDNGG